MAVSVARLSVMQRQTARLLAKSRAETVEVTVFGDLDVSALVALRAEMGAGAPTVTHFILAALARVLAAHPRFNAHLDGTDLALQPRADIGFAVSQDSGDLVSPVLRDVGALALTEIAAQARTLVARARAGQLELADMRGAGFTFSSVGGHPAVRYATPVIPVPQVAILAATAIREEPVARDGAVAVAPVLPVSLSFDHRALNGVAASAFLQSLADVLAAPRQLLEPAQNSKGQGT